MVLRINSQYPIHHNKMVYMKEKTELLWKWQGVLFEKKLPKSFSCEVVNTTIYLLNKLVTKVVEV